MMYLRFLLIGLILLAYTNTFSQPVSFNIAGMTGLDVYQKENLPLAPMVKDKFVILDFFATWCVPCVTELARLDSIQKKFNDRLQVVVIAREDRSMILKFLEKKPFFKNISLPIIVNDTQLNNLFPHVIIPHEIWIDNKDTVVGITSHKEVSTDNIERFISRADMKFLDTKIDFVNFDYEKTYFTQLVDHVGSGFIGHSSCFGFVRGIGSQLGIKSNDDGRITRFAGTDLLPLDYFYSAFVKFKAFEINRKRILFEKKDSAAIFEYKEGNIYTYEFETKDAAPPDQFAAAMIENLNCFSKVKAKVEKRMVTAWNIVLKKGAGVHLKSKGGQLRLPGSSIIRNVPMADLAEFLSLYKDMEPVFDETGLTEHVDLDLEFSMDTSKYPDIQAINRSFSKYGLRIVPCRRLADMLILSVKK